jgi:SAM-dependent methyltransferase
MGTPDAAEETVLERAVGPVLDIGCGVGRHVVALRARGVRAVGVEISSVAVAIARERGAEVIEASAFEHPTTSEWRSILLLDGNIGIGGDAVRLLRRCDRLLAPGGAVLVELEPPATAPRAQRVRLEGARAASDWIPWHFVDFQEIDRLASAAGFAVAERWQADGRWFAHLRPTMRSRKPADSAGNCERSAGGPSGEAACLPPD